MKKQGSCLQQPPEVYQPRDYPVSFNVGESLWPFINAQVGEREGYSGLGVYLRGLILEDKVRKEGFVANRIKSNKGNNTWG